jgi:hypothetical protein
LQLLPIYLLDPATLIASYVLTRVVLTHDLVVVGRIQYFVPSDRAKDKMSNTAKYILVSLPTSISSSNDRDGALAALQSTISTDNGTVSPFKIPDFKIGTLDALIQQADSLAKLNNSCESVVAKVGDYLRGILEGDEAKVSQQKAVHDSMT